MYTYSYTPNSVLYKLKMNGHSKGLALSRRTALCVIGVSRRMSHRLVWIAFRLFIFIWFFFLGRQVTFGLEGLDFLLRDHTTHSLLCHGGCDLVGPVVVVATNVAEKVSTTAFNERERDSTISFSIRKCD